MNIYIQASNQYQNMYAYANTNEKVQMEKLSYLLKYELDKYECAVMVATKNYIRDRAIEAAAWGADFAISLHSNAATGTASGTRGYYNINYTVSKNMAQRLCDELDLINPYHNGYSRIVNDYSYLDIWEFGSRKVPSILAEIAFHDNPSEAKWIVENLPAIAKAITNCFVKEFNLVLRGASGGSTGPIEVTPAPVTAQPDPADSTTLKYRVQVGAFSNKANADSTAAKLKGDGYSIYMIKVDNLYKVQVGAFAVKANADALAAQLRAKGYGTYVTTKSGVAVPIGEVAAPVVLKVGDKVKVKAGSTTYSGEALASFVYQTTYTILELSGSRAVIGVNGVVTAAINTNNLLKI